jgi:hypothetical protein
MKLGKAMKLKKRIPLSSPRKISFLSVQQSLPFNLSSRAFMMEKRSKNKEKKFIFSAR